MKEVNAKKVITTLKKYILVDGFHIVIDLEKSYGPYIVDACTGKRYLDCYTYFASLPLGHNHPKMFDQSFLKKLQLAALSNPANSDIYTTIQAEAVRTFGRIAKPKEFIRMFFVAGGALAVENCLKAAFDWKVQKNFIQGYDIERGCQIAHLRQAFHGRSGYTLSLTNTDSIKIDRYPKFDWPRILNPKLKFPATAAIIDDVKKAEAKALSQFRDAIRKNQDDIAALIIEPIQGEGGDNHFRPKFLRALRKICDENDILMICDEIQTGMGMTGKMWAYQHFGIVPDLIAFGKKTQVCGVMAGPRIQKIIANVFKVSGRINSTWGGNLVDFVRGARYLEIIKEDNLVNNARIVGEYFLNEIYEDLYDGEKITNARGRGLMIAFDLADQKERDKFRQKAWDNGLATLACGNCSVRFRPALTFTKENVDEAITIMKKCL